MIAKLHLQTALRNNKTYLEEVYHTTPFKIANITEDKSEKTLHLMLMSSSPGILDGDEYDIQIEVAEGTSFQLHTQSFQRIFNMKAGASQTMNVNMATGSSFSFIPHPSVPHKASSFVARNKIYLADGCCLTWGEILTCGRKLSGEQFRFSKYHNITEIYFDQRLVVKENLLMQPSIVDVNAMGQLEGYTHQATLILISPDINVDQSITQIHKHLGTQCDICFGVSALQINGVIVRLLGYKGEQLHTILKQIAKLFHSQKDATDTSTVNAKEEAHAN